MGISQRKRRRDPEHTYRRPNGIYYARISVDGVEHRQSLKTRDREEAARRVARWLEGRSPYKGTIRHTFQEAAALWLEAGQWKEKTLRGYAKLLRIIEEEFGERYWDQVDKPALLRFIEKRKAAGSGVATINRYLSVISGIADHVRELPGWPEINPVRLLPKKPRKETRIRYIRPPVSDIDAIFARMSNGTFRDLCTFALRTGARKDEITTLLRADAEKGKAQLWMTKHNFRVISLEPDVAEIVDRQPKHKSGYLFVTRNGDRYKRVTEMWRETVGRAQKAAQKEGRRFQRMRFHDLRHEYAIRYLENGGNIYTLQKLLGHSTIRQTEEYLDYLTPEQVAIAKGQTAQKASH
jgi:integrase/recombinase XerD